jgi:hypothetical protein
VKDEGGLNKFLEQIVRVCSPCYSMFYFSSQKLEVVNGGGGPHDLLLPF